MKRLLFVLLALFIAGTPWTTGITNAGGGETAAWQGHAKWGSSDYGKNVHHTTYGWVTEGSTLNADGTVTVTIIEVPAFQEKTYTTAIPLNDGVNTNPVTGMTRADALVNNGSTTPGFRNVDGVIAKDNFVEIQFDSQNRCINMELIEYSDALYMDSASFGGELTARGGGPGSMVSQGWILGKSASQNTITIGDGNHVTNVFEETYTLADDCKIFLVDNMASDGTKNLTGRGGGQYNLPGSWRLVREGDFDDINVVEKINGEIYYVPKRWTAVCVFDSNYQNSWKDGSAKVRELYLYAKPIIMGEYDLNTPDGMQYLGTSWYPIMSKLENITDYSYNGSAEPFALMEDRLYSVGDTYTSIWLFVGDDGTLSLLDQGNRTASYQYWLNIEKMGYDPREVDNIVLTHGHGDHYQALYENALMIERAGNEVSVGVNSYAQGATITNGKTTYTVDATLRDKPVLSVVDRNPEWDAWLDIMGGGIDIYIWRALGHSNDTASFIFKMTATDSDVYFDEGDVVSWAYYGGYGAVPSLSRGASRLAIVAGLQYEQAVIAPWAAAQSDYVYCLQQHTNQYPMHEVWKASRVAHVPIMEALSEGIEPIANFCEKRVSVAFYEQMEQDYRNERDSLGNLLKERAGFRATSSGTTNFDTIQAHGPFKRPAGEYTIGVKAVNVVHGFDAFLNKTEVFAGQTNVYGFPLDQGLLIDKDSYTNDPDGWYVQVICNVQDDYDGGVVYETNWYKGNYTYGPDDKPLESPWTSGPIEFSINPDGWVEILRTERIDSEQEAIALAQMLTDGTYSTSYETHSVAGGNLYSFGDTANHSIEEYSTGMATSVSYRVNLTNASEILLGDDFSDTFRRAD